MPNLTKKGGERQRVYFMSTEDNSGSGKENTAAAAAADALFALIKKLSHIERKRIRGWLYLPPGRRET